MNGTVTWETLTWVVGIITVAGMAVAGFLFWVWRVLKDQQKDFKEELAARDVRIGALVAKVDVAESALAEYRVHAAESFATKGGVTEAIGRMESAIEKLTSLVHDSVDRLTTRLDRFLDNSSRDRDPPARRGS